jgi:hypothetical protein
VLEPDAQPSGVAPLASFRDATDEVWPPVSLEGAAADEVELLASLADAVDEAELLALSSDARGGSKPRVLLPNVGGSRQRLRIARDAR